jgi:hypothetical protein
VFELKRYEWALASYDQALAIQPDFRHRLGGLGARLSPRANPSSPGQCRFGQRHQGRSSAGGRFQIRNGRDQPISSSRCY